MEGIVLLIVFILGTAIGSFLNVLADRLPKDKGIGGRSLCDYCNKILDVAELVPVLSYIVQKGRSACCKKPLSAFYPFVEMLTGIVFVLVYIYIGFQPLQLLLYWVLYSVLIVIFTADIKYHIIPDLMVIALIIIATPLVAQNMFTLVIQLGAGLILFSGMLLIYALTKGKGMGFGDVKLAFAIGYLLGLKAGFFAIYIGFILGGIFALALLALTRTVLSPAGGQGRTQSNWTLKSKIAFGPFLITGTVIMLLWHKEIFELVNSLF